VNRVRQPEKSGNKGIVIDARHVRGGPSGRVDVEGARNDEANIPLSKALVPLDDRVCHLPAFTRHTLDGSRMHKAVFHSQLVQREWLEKN